MKRNWFLLSCDILGLQIELNWNFFPYLTCLDASMIWKATFLAISEVEMEAHVRFLDERKTKKRLLYSHSQLPSLSWPVFLLDSSSSLLYQSWQHIVRPLLDSHVRSRLLSFGTWWTRCCRSWWATPSWCRWWTQRIDERGQPMQLGGRAGAPARRRRCFYPCPMWCMFMRRWRERTHLRMS